MAGRYIKDEGMAKNVRLQKYLAESGVASRRKAEELIAAGEVKVLSLIHI